jgi:hypothetical protein
VHLRWDLFVSIFAQVKLFIIISLLVGRKKYQFEQFDVDFVQCGEAKKVERKNMLLLQRSMESNELKYS